MKLFKENRGGFSQRRRADVGTETKHPYWPRRAGVRFSGNRKCAAEGFGAGIVNCGQLSSTQRRHQIRCKLASQSLWESLPVTWAIHGGFSKSCMEEEIQKYWTHHMLGLFWCARWSRKHLDTDLGLTARVSKGHRYVSQVAMDMGLKQLRFSEVEGHLFKRRRYLTSDWC